MTYVDFSHPQAVSFICQIKISTVRWLVLPSVPQQRTESEIGQFRLAPYPPTKKQVHCKLPSLVLKARITYNELIVHLPNIP